MKIRDADLRQAVHANGARPGSDLWRLLLELQRRRDESRARPSETGASQAEYGASRGSPRDGPERAGDSRRAGRREEA